MNCAAGCFNPCFNGSDSKRAFPLLLKYPGWGCFNPCFNGSDSKSFSVPAGMGRELGFNPCFNGSDSKSLQFHSIAPMLRVSILVLMEVTLKVPMSSFADMKITVSILVLMEVTLKVGPKIEPKDELKVSILVLMEVTLKAAILPASINCFLFQSLF